MYQLKFKNKDFIRNKKIYQLKFKNNPFINKNHQFQLNNIPCSINNNKIQDISDKSRLIQYMEDNCRFLKKVDFYFKK